MKQLMTITKDVKTSLYESILSSTGTGKKAITDKFLEEYVNCMPRVKAHSDGDGNVIFDTSCAGFSVRDGKLYIITKGNNYIPWPDDIKIARVDSYIRISVYSNEIPKPFIGTQFVSTDKDILGILLDLHKDCDCFPEKFVNSLDLRLLKKEGYLELASYNDKYLVSNLLEKTISNSNFLDTNLFLSAVSERDNDRILDLNQIKQCRCNNILVGVSYDKIRLGDTVFDVDSNNPEVFYRDEIQKLFDEFVKVNDITTITFQSHSVNYGYNIYYDKEQKKYCTNFVDLCKKRRKKLK